VALGTAVVSGVAVALVLLAGCDDNGDHPSPASSAPGRTGSLPTSLAPSGVAAQAAIIAYRGMWNAWVEAGKTSDSESPALRTYASGDALKLIVSALLTHKQNQQVSLGEPVVDPKVTEVKPADAPTEATISDCVNDEKWLLYKASGGLVNDVPGGRHNMTATVTATNGTWQVSYFKLGKVGTC
jgi:hypothetical protein